MGYRAFGELPSSQEKLGSIAFLAIALVFEYLAVVSHESYISEASTILLKRTARQ